MYFSLAKTAENGEKKVNLYTRITTEISDMFSHKFILVLFAVVIIRAYEVCVDRNRLSPPELVLSFVVLNFDFGSNEERQTALESKAFIPKNCFLNKVESFRGCLYIAVPRLFSGIPFSLVTVDRDRDGLPILQPFPNRDVHSLGDCNDIQMCLSFTIDINTGIMWVIDAGHVIFADVDDPFRTSFCPAKLLGIRLRSRKVVFRYVFPESVVPAETNILNDLVLDYVKGKLAFIYITDTGSEAIVVFDFKNFSSFNVKHSTMSTDPTFTVVPFPNDLPPLEAAIGIDGIAMSCDFRYVYYKVFSRLDFYRIPAHVLRNGGRDFDARFEHLGQRKHHVDGMMYSTKHILYYSAVNESAIDRWFIAKEACMQDANNVTLGRVQRIAQNDREMEFADAIAIDENGFIFFMANRLNRFFQGRQDVSGESGTNFHIWKQKLGRGERKLFMESPAPNCSLEKVCIRTMRQITLINDNRREKTNNLDSDQV